MKFAVCLTLLMVIAAVSAFAGDLYDNGPLGGKDSAWNINFGSAATDSMTVQGTVTSLSFYAWLFLGDQLSSVEISIGSQPFGTNLFDGFVNVTQSSHCTLNEFQDFDICLETATFSGPTLNGPAWLTLQNGSTAMGDPVFWDENSGIGCTSPGCPSQAQFLGLGTIPSESFTIYGNANGTTPEPGSILLLGSGLVGLAGLVRRGKR